jgi:hypothetical protein
MLIIPDHYRKHRLRQLADGSYMLARNHPPLVKWLDDNAIRVTNELRWFEIPITGKKLKDLRCIFQGIKCYIIGKGPSLDYISEKDFKNTNYPILAINESIHKIEQLDLQNPIFAIQQDSSLKDSCLPKYSDILVSYQASRFYTDYNNKYIYIPSKYKMTQSFLTVSIAIEIIKSLGGTGIILMCFDSCVNQNLDYAKCIGHTPHSGGNPKRFLKHLEIINKSIKGISVQMVIPKKDLA